MENYSQRKMGMYLASPFQPAISRVPHLYEGLVRVALREYKHALLVYHSLDGRWLIAT